MHKIITASLTREKPLIGEDTARTRGFMVAIEPPVDLVPQIVARALSDGTLGDARFQCTETPFTQVSLVGSTEDRTVIYARLFNETNDSEELSNSLQILRQRTRELLGVLGINGVEYDSEVKPLTNLV